MASVLSINISEKKGTPKTKINPGVLIEDFGFEGDAHAGKWHRQVSFLAKESIERASDAMSGNVTPEISRKASEIMERISGGKHPALRTTKQLELSVDEDGFGFSAELLSEGARDAAYIALRISLMLSIFGDQLPPLMLDDALCQFDDNRAKIMIDILSRLSEIPLQSVIFTCHAREKMICEENGISHTYTRLN